MMSQLLGVLELKPGMRQHDQHGSEPDAAAGEALSSLFHAGSRARSFPHTKRVPFKRAQKCKMKLLKV